MFGGVAGVGIFLIVLLVCLVVLAFFVYVDSAVGVYCVGVGVVVVILLFDVYVDCVAVYGYCSC